MSYSSRHHRYYDSTRSSGSSRSQQGNVAMAEETSEGFSEDLQKIYEDDSKCARLLKKIFREDRSYELKLQRIVEFESYVEKSDSNKFIMKLAQPALNLLFEHFQERSTEAVRAGLARCIGAIGYVMLNENDGRFADWIFERLYDVRKNDFQRDLLIDAFHRSLANEQNMLCLNDRIGTISEQLKKILESVVHVPLMMTLTNTILDLTRIYPHVFRNHFADIVDILIGWYIEPLTTDRVLDFTAEALQKFRPFWLEQLEGTTLTLLDHFIEDADNYAQQFDREKRDRNDQSISFTDKIAALYRAFASVLRALSEDFAQTPNLLPFDYVENWFQKILHTTAMIREDFSFGLVAKSANFALTILFETFRQFDPQTEREVFEYIIEQSLLKEQKWPYEADTNLLRLISKLLDLINQESAAQLASAIFAPSSRLWTYRFLQSNALIQDVLHLFNRFLTMKSIPVVQQVYQAILADMTMNFNVLLQSLKQKTLQLGTVTLTNIVSDSTDDDAEGALIFDCSALCQIGNIKGNLIGMYALTPPLFELLAKQLPLTNCKLAERYPAVHYAILKTLYSHCAAHEHFIHNSDLFKQSDQSNTMSLTSLNKDNFEDLLKLHHRLIVNSHLNCHDTKKLVLNWLAEIIDALPQEDNGLLALPLLLKLSHAIIDIAYSDEEEICNLCCRLLNKIVKRQRNLDVSFLVRLFDLCRFWLQSNETSIHDSYYAILCCLPVNILTSKFPTHGTLLSSKNDYSGFASLVKRNHMSTPYSGTFTTHCFNLILGYILVNHQMPRMYANTWLERLFQSCQRKTHQNASKDEQNPSDQQHQRMLTYEQLPNFGNDALIWFWAIWECAQFCVMNKLKTPLGKPQETFLALEETLRSFAWPIDLKGKSVEGSSSDHTHRSSTPSSTTNPSQTSASSSSNELHPSSSEKAEWWSDLHRCGLLLQLLEALEKCMYNAYEGSALSLPALPKTVKFFFMTNKFTCLEWLNRIRIPIILTAVRSGQYEAATRNCNQYLQHVCALGQAEASEFEFVIISLVQSLIKLHNSMAIHGLYVWLKSSHQLDWPWIKASEHEAAGNLEQAAYEYKLLLNEHFQSLSETNGEKISAALVKFLTQKVYDCYLSLHQWPELLQWNEAYLKMQLAFLKENDDDLRTAMETTIDMNAIRAMSCFENRDFEGLKVAMRKMPNAQATGEELGRSIACGWDMEAFDMLATVETLKGVSKRRSGLWSLNAVLQLTQDLTRIHNVDEHASWSEERAAISQVAALYQSENREVPLLVGQKFAPVQHSVRALNSVLLYSQTSSNNQTAGSSISSSINSNWTALRMGAARLARQQNNFTLASKLLIQQFQSSHNWSSSISTSESYTLSSLLTLLERYSNSHAVTIELETETAKLMQALSLNRSNNVQITLAIDFLARSVLRHLFQESQTSPSYSHQRSLITLEKCSRNLLHIAKWSKRAMEKNFETSKNNVLSLGKLFQLRKQYLLSGLGVDIAAEPFVRSNVPLDDLLIGELLDFSTVTGHNLAKTWFRFADWSYTWGRQLLARSVPLSPLTLESQVRAILPSDVTSEETAEVCRILLSIRVLNDDDSELTASEFSLIHSYRSDLSRACASLVKQPELIDQLLSLHPQFDRSRYFLLEQSCRAYFSYLQLSNTNQSIDHDDASNILVTLRLLRVLVRYPEQLRMIFERNFPSMPTIAWKRLVPQLFSRLNHPNSLVRDYVTNLLTRLAKDFPQFVLYSVIVGMTDESNMRRFISRRKSSLSIGNSDDEIDEDEDVDVDVEDDGDEEEFVETQENILAMQNSFRSLYNVLSEINADVVGQVKLFVHELRRVTVLWDELWLGTMAQLQEEISRRVDALKEDLHRLESMTHLTKEEKEYLIKEKQDVLFKSFLTVLEAVRQITNAPAETPREQAFQKDYSKQIDAAIEQLKQPIHLSNPHACWLQLRQLYSMLHRTGKRSGASHAINQISPKLAQIKHSVIPIPGDDGQFHTIHSVGQTVQVLPTKTRPKKFMFVGSNGRRYQYLLKGLEDLHLDERIMQLLSMINVMFTKINRNEPWSYEARNYTVIPLASRSGLIQWVEGATPLFTLYKRWQQRQATAQSWKAQNENQDVTLITAQKPNEVYYSKLNAILKEKGKAPVEDRKDLPMPILRQCLEELIRETPEDLLSRELWCSCPSVGLWYKNVQNYSRSLAVTSMIGYMIGLGDRHLDNVLVDLKSGQIIHIDYNICFEKGKKLRVPEKVPYRLTQNLQHALGVAGLEGVFSLSSENVLRILRHGKEILLNLLESFIYDPLIDWTGHDTGVLAAFYGGQSRLYEQITSKKRQVEKDSLIRMFQLRVMEIKPNWLQLGESIQRTMTKLSQRVQDLFELDQNLQQSDSKMTMFSQCLDYFKGALNSTDHEFFTLIERRDQLRQVQTELNEVKEEIFNHYQTLNQILTTSSEAHRTFQSKSFGDQLRNFLANDHSQFSPSPLSLAAEFLQTIGKSALLHQSEQLDEELRHALKTFRAARQPAVEHISKNFIRFYRYLPIDYVQSSSLNTFKDRLNDLHNDFSSTKCEEFLQHIDNDENPSNRTDLTTRALNIDTQLFTTQQLIHQELQKLSEVQSYQTMALTDDSIYRQGLTGKLQKLDPSEYSNYVNTLVLTLFDRWQHSRQIEETIRHLIRFASASLTNNEILIEDTFTLFHQIASFASLIEQNSIIMAMHSPLIHQLVQLIHSVKDVFSSFKNLLDDVQRSIFPSFFRAASSKQSELGEIFEALNQSHQQIQPLTSLPNTSSVDQTCQMIYQQLRSTWKTNPNELSQSFANLADLFDRLDEPLHSLIEHFQRTEIPLSWCQSPLFNWKQTNISNDAHRRFLTNVFTMTKISTMKQLCQLIIEHSNALENFQTPIVHHLDLINVIQQYILLFTFQNLIDLPSLSISYLILSLIPSVTSVFETTLIENDLQFQELIHALCPISLTANLTDLQQYLAQMHNLWQQNLHQQQIQKSSEILRIRLETEKMQLMAFRWKNFQILRTSETINEREVIFQELTIDENVLALSDPTTSMLSEKMTNLEQIVLQRLRWASGANPSIGEILNQFESRQKQRANEIETDQQLCSHIVQTLRSWTQFEQIKLQTEFIQRLRTTIDKALKISQMKTAIESQLSEVEQMIFDFSFDQSITSKSIPSLIEQVEQELTKEKRIRMKEERDMENRREETTHLISELKEEISQHNSLFKDLSSILKNLLKFFSHHQLQTYLTVHREFLESTHTVLKHTLHIDRTSSMKYDTLITKIKRILTLKTKVFDELIQLDPTIDPDDRERIPSSTAQTDPIDKTIKINEERNKYALEICKRIRDKLDGCDPDPSVSSSISDQVQYTIREATEIENLATLYEGWTSWV